jgi:hypothetical protein
VHRLEQIARTAGDSDKVISATPSQNPPEAPASSLR